MLQVSIKFQLNLSVTIAIHVHMLGEVKYLFTYQAQANFRHLPGLRAERMVIVAGVVVDCGEPLTTEYVKSELL